MSSVISIKNWKHVFYPKNHFKTWLLGTIYFIIVSYNKSFSFFFWETLVIVYLLLTMVILVRLIFYIYQGIILIYYSYFSRKFPCQIPISQLLQNRFSFILDFSKIASKLTFMQLKSDLVVSPYYFMYKQKS